MGSEQSILAKKGYVVEENGTVAVATKGDEKFLIIMIPLHKRSRNAELMSEILNINHPNIVNIKETFTDEEKTMNYVVTDYCQGGSLAAKIKETNEPREAEVLSWIVEICMALKKIHDKDLLQKNLTPEDIHFTEFGILRLSRYQKVYENSKNTRNSWEISYLAPEVYTEGKYDVKSDIWSLGCILYELCTGKPAFLAESTIKLMPKILSGPYPSLPDQFSPELCQLLKDMMEKDPCSRPTISEILGDPLIINSLYKKIKKTVNGIQEKVDALTTLANGLERVHRGTTIGSLTGGVIGAVGGITSIVGLILAPFTLGTSLVFTGIGVGVAAVGGLMAGASNITKMVNQSTDRKAVRNVIKETEQRIDAVVIWLQEFSNSLHTIQSRCEELVGGDLKKKDLLKIGLRAGKGLAGIAELVRLVEVMSVGRIAEEVTRVAQVAEMATGVFSALFLAVDIFFIAMDAKEIHHIRQARGANGDDTTPLIDNQSSTGNTEVKSELMKFVQSIRQAAGNLKKVVDELKFTILSIPSLNDGRALTWDDMELI